MIETLAAIAEKFDSQIEGSMNYVEVKVFSDGSGCIAVRNTSPKHEDELAYIRFEDADGGNTALAGCGGGSIGDHVAALLELSDDSELDAALLAYIRRTVRKADISNPNVVPGVVDGALRSQLAPNMEIGIQ